MTDTDERRYYSGELPQLGDIVRLARYDAGGTTWQVVHISDSFAALRLRSARGAFRHGAAITRYVLVRRAREVIE